MSHRAVLRIAAVLPLALGCAQSPSAPAPLSVSGERALEHVRAQVAFGPRPPGSEALAACRRYLVAQLERFGYQVEDDAFEASTPYGPKRMHNLIARRRGDSPGGVPVVLGSHYDTKYFAKGEFVGANDGASSTGLLLELARVLAVRGRRPDTWFVLFDGEEAFIEWSTFDSTYGSRHLARRWKQDGTAARVGALLLLDMIGDRDLDLWSETHSTAWLRELVWTTAGEIGLGGILSTSIGGIEDDHLPFLDAGIPAVDLIDLNYGPGNSYHHHLTDTLDKVSAESLEKVGRLVLAVLPKLEARSTR